MKIKSDNRLKYTQEYILLGDMVNLLTQMIKIRWRNFYFIVNYKKNFQEILQDFYLIS